jgi:hypothetical protein
VLNAHLFKKLTILKVVFSFIVKTKNKNYDSFIPRSLLRVKKLVHLVVNC